jgi:hypothetical protein
MAISVARYEATTGVVGIQLMMLHGAGIFGWMSLRETKEN